MNPEKTTDILMKIAICVDINSQAVIKSTERLKKSRERNYPNCLIRNEFHIIGNRLNQLKN